MIVKALLDLLYMILDALLIFNLPDLPDTVYSVIETIVEAIMTGWSILVCFCGSTAAGVIVLLFRLVIYMHGVYFLWSFVFWILRKIPLFSVKE